MSTELHVQGARCVLFRRDRDGQRGTLAMKRSTPLSRLLSGPRLREPLNRFADEMRISPERSLELLTFSSANVELIRACLLDERTPTLSKMVTSLCEDFKELKRVFKQATGGVLTRQNDFQYATPDEMLAMLDVLAAEVAEEEGSGLTGDRAFWRLITAADVAQPGPWRDLDFVSELIGQHLEYLGVQDGVSMYGPRCDDGSVALDLRVQAHGAWQRIIILGAADSGRFTAAVIDADDVAGLNEPAADRMVTLEFSDAGALMRWLETHAAGSQLTETALGGVTDMTVTLHGDAPLEQTVARFTVPDGCGADRVMGRAGEDLVSVGVAYNSVQTLRDRAAALGVKGRSGMDVDELREAIAREAMQRAPVSELVDGGAFLRPVRAGAADAPKARECTLEQLESLACHALAKQFAHAGMDGLPVRLRDTIDFVDAVAPLNPFAR